MTDVLDQWSLLDRQRSRVQVNAALGSEAIDQWGVLDPARFAAEFNAQKPGQMSDGTNAISTASNAVGLIAPNTWYGVQVGLDLNHAAGARIVDVFLNDVSVPMTPQTDIGNAITVPFHANGFGIPVGLSGFDAGKISFADYWFDTSFVDWTVTANRRKFIDANKKPVDPSGFPASAILFSGDHASFPTNRGSGGAFTLHGALTDASSHP